MGRSSKLPKGSESEPLARFCTSTPSHLGPACSSKKSLPRHRDQLLRTGPATVHPAEVLLKPLTALQCPPDTGHMPLCPLHR